MGPRGSKLDQVGGDPGGSKLDQVEGVRGEVNWIR